MKGFDRPGCGEYARFMSALPPFEIRRPKGKAGPLVFAWCRKAVLGA